MEPGGAGPRCRSPLTAPLPTLHPELPGRGLRLPGASGVVSGVLAPALRAAPSVLHSPDLFDQPLLYQPRFLILPTPYLILVTFYRQLCALCGWLI